MVEKKAEITEIETEAPVKTAQSAEDPPHQKPEFESALEKETPERRALLKVASSLLSTKEFTKSTLEIESSQLLDLLQQAFQENIKHHYRETGLAVKIKAIPAQESLNPTGVPFDEQAVNLIADLSQGTHGWVDMLPNLRKEDPEAGLNCTMGSALLHLALEDLGFDHISTVLREGHHVVIREMSDGSMKLYDPTSLSTKDEKLVGYSRTFVPSEIERRDSIVGKGYGFELDSAGEDKIGGFMKPNDAGQYRQSFFAYEPEVKMDLAIALENLSEIKEDADKLDAEQQPPFDIDAYREALVAFIKENNQKELSDADILEIANSNRQPIEELTQAASSFFESGGQIQNPYDYLASPLLQPKTELTQMPNPKKFTGSSERYEQAKQLCTKYPELRELDFKSIKSKLALFDGHDYL
jgi:hypothetical protein